MNDYAKFEERNKENTIEVVPYGQRPACQAPSAIIELAINRGADLEKLEKLMELQERYDQQQAKKDYTKAMTEFKAAMPKVFKDKENKQYKSMYASESALLNTLNPFLSQFKLSANFSFPDSEGDLFRVTCTITHENGYSDSVTLKGPLDTSGSKNPLQQVKSTVTYLRKATFEAITGIATSDPDSDDDGNSSEKTQHINVDMQTEINDLLKSTKADKKRFFDHFKVDSVETIPMTKYGEVISLLKEKKEVQEKAKPKPMREPGEEG